MRWRLLKRMPLADGDSGLFGVKIRLGALGYAAEYVFQQAQSSPANPTTIGTGSTPFLPYLRKHRDETAASLI